MVWAILGEPQSEAIKEILESRSDRIIAIVGGAILDETLKRTLEERLRNDRNISNKSFKLTGPLGNPGGGMAAFYAVVAGFDALS